MAGEYEEIKAEATDAYSPVTARLIKRIVNRFHALCFRMIRYRADQTFSAVASTWASAATLRVYLPDALVGASGTRFSIQGKVEVTTNGGESDGEVHMKLSDNPVSGLGTESNVLSRTGVPGGSTQSTSGRLTLDWSPTADAEAAIYVLIRADDTGIPIPTNTCTLFGTSDPGGNPIQGGKTDGAYIQRRPFSGQWSS